MAILNNLREVRSWMDAASPHVVPRWQIDLVEKHAPVPTTSATLIPSAMAPTTLNHTNGGAQIPTSYPVVPWREDATNSITPQSALILARGLVALNQTRLDEPKLERTRVASSGNLMPHVPSIQRPSPCTLNGSTARARTTNDVREDSVKPAHLPSPPQVANTPHESDDFDDDDFIDLSLLKILPVKRPAPSIVQPSKRLHAVTSTQESRQVDLSVSSVNVTTKPSAGSKLLSARNTTPLKIPDVSYTVDLTPSKDTDVQALQAYILACENKINLLTKCNAVSDSTSLSLDAKKLWHAKKYKPKMRALNDRIESLRCGFTFLKPVPTDLSNIHSDSSFVKVSSHSIISSPITTTIAPANDNQHFDASNTKETQDFISNTESVQHHQSYSMPLENNFDDNLDEARRIVLSRRNKTPSPPPLHDEIDEEDPEDILGENYMEGLQSSQVDDVDTDLSGFVAHDEDDEDEEFADRTYTYTQATQTERLVVETDDDDRSQSLVQGDLSIRHEIDDIKLSQDVAERYSITYDRDTRPVEISDEESENDDGNFTTQLLNEGRDQVVEIFSDDEFNDDDFAVFETRPHVKHELPVVKTHNVEESDFSDDDDEILKIAAVDGVDGPDKELLAGSEAFIDEVYSVLRDTFKLSSFRPNQLKAVISTLKGKDVFVLIPTGGGKSLCYQLPALVTRGKTRGTTVVISPLISLMQDQIHHLQKKNIRADMISSRGSAKEKSEALRSFAAGNLDLVYLSPEMVNKAQSIQRILTKLYENNMLARIVVDEAHCVSSWGHDFRPDYQGMSMFKENYPKVPVMALTATANEKVRLDIINNLRMNDAVLLKQSFNRTNLFYTVMKKPGNIFEWLRDYISMQQCGKTGIIYCHSKQSCETTSEKLEAFGIKCKFYHAGMDADERLSVQTDWQENRIQVICATIAFGMGIDKPDVRFVIHIYIPRTLEGYYQETGRAGRDGKPSECIMFYAYKDARSLKGLIEKDKDLDWSSREMHLAKLRQVIQYCENGTDCRRRQVLHYFNEIFDAKLCNKNCDNCCSEIVSVKRDVTEHCSNIVKLVQTIHMDKVTVIHCQDVYWGSKNQKIMTLGHYNNPYHGSGRDLNKGDMERIFFFLQCENALMEYQVVKGGYATSYVKLGPLANAFIKANKKVELSFAQTERPTSSGPAKLTASGNGSGIANFRYQESFRSAREVRNQEDAEKRTEIAPSRIVLPQNTFEGAITDSNSDLINKAYFELRNARTLKVSELGYARAEAFIGNNLLKEMAIKLPTNARDFARLEHVTKEQTDHFKHFKQVLTTLSRDRKKSLSGHTDLTQQSPVIASSENGSHSSPYFQQSQTRSKKSSGTQKRQSREKKTQRWQNSQRRPPTQKLASKAVQTSGSLKLIRAMPI